MGHFAGSYFHKPHPVRDILDRVESVIVLGLIGAGLAACALGAVVYDVERWLSAL